jgi:hypothetical protein
VVGQTWTVICGRCRVSSRCCQCCCHQTPAVRLLPRVSGSVRLSVQPSTVVGQAAGWACPSRTPRAVASTGIVGASVIHHAAWAGAGVTLVDAVQPGASMTRTRSPGSERLVYASVRPPDFPVPGGRPGTPLRLARFGQPLAIHPDARSRNSGSHFLGADMC